MQRWWIVDRRALETPVARGLVFVLWAITVVLAGEAFRARIGWLGLVALAFFVVASALTPRSNKVRARS